MKEFTRDISQLSDEALVKRAQELSVAAAAIREERKLIAAEVDQRANAKELQALAAKLGPEKLAELTKLAQTVAPKTIASEADSKPIG